MAAASSFPAPQVHFFEQLLQQQPEHIQALKYLGNHAAQQQQTELALGYFERLYPLSPTDLEVLIALVNLHKRQHHYAQSLGYLKQGLAHHAENPWMHYCAALFWQDIGDMEKAIATLLPAAQAIHSSTWSFDSLLMAAYSLPQITPEQFQTWHRQWEQRFAVPLYPQQLRYPNTPNPERRLRVGYLGADFKRHSAVHVYFSVFAQADREQFELFLYDSSPGSDDIAQWFQHQAGHWHNVMGWSDEQVASQINQDHIDILMDLSCHTHGHRLLTLARRPAPIQVTGLGFAATTGLQAIQYRIADPISLPDSHRKYHTETIVDMSCWSRLTPALLPAGLPNKPPPMLQRGYPTFGYGNTLNKLNVPLLQLWVKLLQPLPDARLHLKANGLDTPWLQHFWQQRWQQLGGNPQQLIFSGGTDYAGHLAFYQDVDVVLDPFPYNGSLSTLEALWMGRPVVTFANGLGTHSGKAHLTYLGYPDWVATSPEDYCTKAFNWVAQPEKLTHLSQTLRTQLRESILCDGTRMAREVEAIYRELWQIWCQQPTI